MKTFTKGTKVFCDFPFGGKPEGVVQAVTMPGDGQRNNGEVRVQLTETVGAYRKGEIIPVRTFWAVPCCMELPRKAGEFIRRVSTQYAYVA